jgi:hypothetical protein
LGKLVRQKEHIFLNTRLTNIHVTDIEKGTMADYMLKTVKRGLADFDDLLILT